MDKAEIKDLAFWITIHQSAYTEGIELAKDFLIAIDRKNNKINEFKGADGVLNRCIDILCENGIDQDKLETLFEYQEEDVKPDLFKKAEELDVVMPEADSY